MSENQLKHLFTNQSTSNTLVGILCLIGGLMVWSSSFFLSHTLYGSGYTFFVKQLIGYLFICISLWIGPQIPPSLFIKGGFFFFFISLFLCIATHFPLIGITINGAHRWIKIFSLIIQPAELLKPFYLLLIATIVSKFKHTTNQLIFYSGIICGITSIVLLLQPDFGHAFLLSLTTLLLIIFSSRNRKKIYLLILCASIIGTIAIITKPYRLKRIITYLNPWADPRGSGFQIIQSLVAIKNGGLTGNGIGKSKQKLLYLPLQHTDFIFSIICEEIGIFGGIAIIFLFYLLFLHLLYRANATTNDIVKQYTTGVAFIIFLQSSLNVLVASAALPTKGIGLPLISYGVSSLVGYGIIFCILQSLQTTQEKNITTQYN